MLLLQPPLCRDQIAALTEEQLPAAYERSRTELDYLLSIIETDNSKKAVLAESINKARMAYVLLRSRAYPDHFKKLNTADLLPSKLGSSTALATPAAMFGASVRTL